MDIPFQSTALTTFIGVVILLSSWYMIVRRSEQSGQPMLRPVRLLSKFFLFMAIFFAIVWLPHLSLLTAPDQFPLLMAVGYVVGHVFLYIALLQVGRMVFAMIPRLAGKDTFLVVVGLVANVAITAVNTVTMIFGVRPVYDYERHISQLNAAPVVGISIAVFALVTLLPAAILFIVNAVRSSGARRVRSLLLGFGFLLQMSAGPLHDVARSWEVYLIADILTILSVVIVGAGVAFRQDQSLAPEAAAQPADPAPILAQ